MRNRHILRVDVSLQPAVRRRSSGMNLLTFESRLCNIVAVGSEAS